MGTGEYKGIETDRVIIVAGPTGSGKSALALALAEHFDGVVINADAIQVYKDLSILTARPTPQQEALVPHRVYGVLAAAERCTAARWRALAMAEISAAHAAGKRPIVVGGTGLYLRVLMQGIAPIPDVSTEIRQATHTLYDALGGAGFRDLLATVDLPAAQRIAPADRQRLTRAWGVHQATGRPLTQWQNIAPAQANPACTAIALLPPRQALYEACDNRFEAMIQGGALEEVAALTKRNLDPSLPLMKAVGLRELTGYVSGDWSLEDAIRRGQQATRRYAKRQYTWFRNQLDGAYFVEEKYSFRIMPEILSKIS